MKRTPFKRRTSELKRTGSLRRSPMKRGRRRARPAHLVDREYSKWIHTQPCCVPGCNDPRIEQHHKREGVGGAALAHDRDSISLCFMDHVPGIHALAGYFKGWTKQRIRDFVNEHIDRLQALYVPMPTGLVKGDPF